MHLIEHDLYDIRNFLYLYIEKTLYNKMVMSRKLKGEMKC